MSYLTIAVLFLLLITPCNAISKQLNFSKVENGDFYQFNYHWLDHYDNEQNMTFSLTKSALFDSFRNFHVYKPKMAAKAISKNVVKFLHKQPIKDVQINYDKATGSIDFKSTDLSQLKKAEDKILTLQAKFTESYLEKNWYHTFTTFNQVTAIKPNHKVIASLSASEFKVIKPVILDKVSIQNIRKATNFVLAFVQNIPYSTLDSRINSSGAGFNPPLKLLWENQGDCDSKVTLTASILRSLMPRIKMVLVFIDKHALIGIDVVPKGDEPTITIEGTTYVLGEPTGPRLLPLGQLDAESELAIEQGQYTAEKFHK